MAQQWKPPDYATPDWTPPDYATPEGERPKRIKKEPTFSDKVIAEIAKIDPRSSAAFAIRGLSAFAPGGPRGAIAGGAGEALAQTIEPREDYNLTQIATQAAIGAIPFGRVATLVRTALKGAAMGAGATTASQLAETGELPSLGQFGLGTTLGAAGGAVASKFAKKIASDLPDIKEGRIFGRLEPEVSTPIKQVAKEELPTPITKPRVRIYPETVKIEEAPPPTEPDFLKAARERFAQASDIRSRAPLSKEEIQNFQEWGINPNRVSGEVESGKILEWALGRSVDPHTPTGDTLADALNIATDARDLGIPFEYFKDVKSLRDVVNNIKSKYSPQETRSTFLSPESYKALPTYLKGASADFTPTIMGQNREEFRRMVRIKMRPPSYVTMEEFNKVADGLFERTLQEDMMARELNELQTTPAGIHVWDPGGRFTPEEYSQIINNPTVQKIGLWMNDLGRIITRALGQGDRIDKFGIVLHQDLRGTTLLDHTNGKAGLFGNPLGLMSVYDPDGAAGGIMHTLLHESVHPSVLGHNEDFTMELSRVHEILGGENYANFVKQLGSILTEGGVPGTVRPGYSPEISEILRRYKEAIGRPDTIPNSVDRGSVISRFTREGQSKIPSTSGRGEEDIRSAISDPSEKYYESRRPKAKTLIQQIIEEELKKDMWTDTNILYKRLEGAIDKDSFDKMVAAARTNIAHEGIIKTTGFGTYSRFGEGEKSPIVDIVKRKIAGALSTPNRLDLEDIYKQFSNSMTRKQFLKIVDDFMSSGNIAQEVAKIKPTPQSAASNLLKTLGEAKTRRAKQDVIYSEERSRRFSEYLKVKTTGVKGAKERLAKLRGEHEKITSPELNMSQDELNVLFDAINTSHLLTPGEMAHASEGLFKLIDGGHVPQLNEIDALERVFGMGFRDSLLNIFSDESGALNTAIFKGLKFAKTANTMKAMMASYDMSAPLRQGLPLIHRKEYWGAAANMFKYASSTKEFTEAMTSLQKRPNYILSREAGLHWSDINSLSHGEEQFGLNTYIHDIHEKLGKTGAILTAPTRASERAYVGFLNKLRHDTFDAMVSAARAAGADVSMKVITGPSGKLKRVPSKDLAAIAKFVNNATGRGELKIGKYDFERFGPLANFAFFSPRLMMSRVNMLLNPKLYSELPKGVRLEGLKSLLSIGSMAAVAGGLASVLGGEQTWNPLSSDFGKARFGEQVLDPYGGFQQYIVLGARLSTMLAGGKISSQEGLFEPSMGSVSGNFLMNKLAPMTSLIIEYMRSTTGKRGDEWYERRNRFGQPMNPVDEVTKRVAPIITQDLYELFTTDQSLAKVLGLGTASFFGMGSQTYPEPNQQRQRLRISSPRLSL